jgi:hypothetical protein
LTITMFNQVVPGPVCGRVAALLGNANRAAT